VDISGQTIDVLMPPWAALPQSLLDDFTAKTGVKVNYTVAEWDAIRDKVAVAGAANSQLADVTEFDWSWTGQFGKAGWFVPLEDKIDSSDLANNGAFTLDGHLYGACYNNDFRFYQYNKKMFDQAGIANPPATFDELLADARVLKQKGIVEFPVLFPLQSEESTAMTYYLNLLALGGQLIDANGKPAFEDPNSGGYKALAFYIQALKEGLIDPAMISMKNEAQGDYWRSGKAAINYGAPSDLVNNEDPKQSKIVGQVQPMLVPGATGPGPSYGQPEGIGIMSASQKQDAALAFIKWWESPEIQTKIYEDPSLGLLPCNKTVLQQLVDQKKVIGGQVLLDEQQYLAPLFPEGAPDWYSKFSTEVTSDINAAAKGSLTVDQAIKKMADTMRDLTGVESLNPAKEFPVDSAAGRQQFAAAMEARRLSEHAQAVEELPPTGWCVGSGRFRQELLQQLERRAKSAPGRPTVTANVTNIKHWSKPNKEGWQVTESPHFIIFHHQDNEFAERVDAGQCERRRHEPTRQGAASHACRSAAALFKNERVSRARLVGNRGGLGCGKNLSVQEPSRRCGSPGRRRRKDT
jgi:multiple sugar transport system substrate-binding protein